MSGFWAKLLLIQSSLQIQHYIVAAIAIAVGMLTVFSMVKIWIKAFWKPCPTPTSYGPKGSISFWKLSPVFALGLITVFIGIGAEPIYQLADTAARELMSPQTYVQAVLAGGVP